MNARELEMKMQGLPEDLRKEILDYMEFLLRKHRGRVTKAKKFKFDWEGGLSRLKDKFSSVDLQNKSLEWR